MGILLWTLVWVLAVAAHNAGYLNTFEFGFTAVMAGIGLAAWGVLEIIRRK